MMTTTNPQAINLATREEIDAEAGIVAPPATVRALAFEPRNFEEAMRLADLVASIRLCGVISPADAMGRIMLGANLGLTAMVAVQVIFSFPSDKGPQHGIYAKAVRALALRHPLCESLRCTEYTETKVTWELKRKDRAEPTTCTWTIERAEKAGLVNRGKDQSAKDQNNYNKHPVTMLSARSSAELVNRDLPEALFGLGIAEEIMERAPQRVQMDVVPQAKARDFGAERDVIKAAILEMTEASMPAVRAQILAFEQDGQPVADLQKLYAEKKPKKSPAAPAPKAEEHDPKTGELPHTPAAATKEA